MRLRGFTIIELLLVITIIGLLLISVGAGIKNARTSSRDARRLSDVSLIAQAIDQSVLVNRGIYPRDDETTNPPKSRMCADLLALSNNNVNKINLSIFPGNRVPKDPRPQTAPSGDCTDSRFGYVYHNQYGPDGNSLAFRQSLGYVLEVALEREKPFDEKNFKTPEELKLSNLGVTVTNPPGRSVFILNGPTCNLCYR